MKFGERNFETKQSIDWKLSCLPANPLSFVSHPTDKKWSKIFPVCDVFQGIFLEAMVVAFAKIVIYSWQHVEWPDLQ